MKPLFILMILTALSSSPGAAQSFDLQGHRGCRGLMPENSIPAFLKAIDLGVNTLEMDVVITKDLQVLVSHEPWMSHVICLDSSGTEILKSREKEYRIYEMTLAQVQQFDCGSKAHPGFPEQERVAVCKPSLREVIQASEEYCRSRGLPPVAYNIETKSTPDGDDIFHPKPGAFVDLLMAVVQEEGIADRTTIQSFDPRTLQYLKQHHPEMRSALLVANVKPMKKNLNELGFTPDIYSPNYLLVNKKLVTQAHQKGMKIIPWTVNKESDFKKMKDLGVDGIITDYPGRMGMMNDE